MAKLRVSRCYLFSAHGRSFSICASNSGRFHCPIPFGWRKLGSSSFPPHSMPDRHPGSHGTLGFGIHLYFPMPPARPYFHVLIPHHFSHALLVIHQQSPCVICRIIPDYTFSINISHVQGTTLSSKDTKMKEMEGKSLRNSWSLSQNWQLLLQPSLIWGKFLWKGEMAES